MAEILDLQGSYDATPEEEKASRLSIAVCRNSYASYVVCFVK